MRHKMERMRQGPGRERIRGIALMHDRESANKIFVREIDKKVIKLRGREHTFIDNRV